MASTFWQDELRGFEPTSFPDLTGASPSVRKGLHGTHVTQAELHQDLEVLVQACRDLNSNLLTLCQVAWAKVLAAYLGESDVCFGCTRRETTSQYSDKDDTGIRPLRMSLSHRMSHDSVLEMTSKTYSKAISHSQPSAELVQSICGPDVDFLYDTLLMFRSEEEERPDLDCIANTENYAILIDLIESKKDNILHINMHCQHALIHPHDTHLIFSAFRQALLSISELPTSSIMTWRPDYPRDQLSRFNMNTETLKSPFGDLVHAAFEFYAESQPDALALDFVAETGARTQWTYKTLNLYADRIANTLRFKHGLLVEDSVPICVPKSPAFYACVLGVLKAGGAFTPFSSAPQERMKFMLDELGSKIVLCVDAEDMSWCLNAKCVDVTELLKDGGPVCVSASDSTNKPRLTDVNLAYHIYTSGSTGRPKAVSVEHRNAVQTVCASRHLIPWHDDQLRMLQYAAPAFDMCYYDVFLTWSHGLCLCSAEDNALFNDLSGVINQLDVSLLGLTPSVALTIDREKVPSVKRMYCIGEAMPQSLVEAWEGKLMNSYGPTEAAQMVSLFPVDRKIKSAIIGKPFRNTSFTILQKDLDAVAPVFAIGELLIGGPQVARGYYANESRTKKSFIDRDGIRMYRTGDNVRMLANGAFEFIGRSDDQVKIRGQRVELGEINSTMRDAHTCISAVSTQILKPNAHSRHTLVAFLVTDAATIEADHPSIQETALSDARRQLPAYMVPKLCIFIDKMPLSAAGKVNKRALANLFQATSRKKNGLAPCNSEVYDTSVEHALRDIFANLSGFPTRDVLEDTSIFHLGLDSISAIQISAQLKGVGYLVSPSDILKYPTIAKLAPLLREEHTEKKVAVQFDFPNFDKRHRPTVLSKVGLSEDQIESVRPCSPLQAAMIVTSKDSLYFNHITYRLSPRVDKGRLWSAWSTLVRRHEILRSGFVHLEDARHPVGMVTYRARDFQVPVKFYDHGGLNVDRWREDMTPTALGGLHRPPWQVKICKDRMYLTVHHSLYDAQVLDIIAADLDNAYNGIPSPNELPFEPYLAMVLEDFGAGASSSRQFWGDRGQSMLATKFPVLASLYLDTKDFGRSSTLCSLTRAKIEAGCRKIGATIQAVGQAAWGLLLAAYVGQDVVTFGTVLSGRSTEDSDRICFPCITTVPTAVNSKITRSACLKQLMDFNAEVQMHQFASLQQIQRWTGHSEDPLFDTLFTFQKRDTSQSHGNLIHYLDNDLIIDYPISIELELISVNELGFRLYHRLDLVPTEQAKLMLKQLDYFFTSFLNDIDCPVNSVETADQHLYSINPAKVKAYRSDCTLLHHFVETSAQKTPSKTALEYVTSITNTDIERRTWSFEDLDNEGNRIANLIRSHGVAQGSIIAVCFDKCPEASFAILGILKAGCGFLALDLGAPTERKRFTMQDSKAAMLITRGVDRGHWTGISAPVLDVEQEDLGRQPCVPPRLDRTIDEQEVAYCLYTSGTTGTPKGCIITHENVVQAMFSFSKLYKWKESSRWLAFASYHFDVSVMEQYWSWSVGICCVIAGKDLILEDLAGTIRKLNISHIDLTPSLAQLLDPAEVPSLADGVFVTGGEMLKRDIIHKWGHTGAIHNAYGPTEATIGCTMYCGVPKNARPSSIGPAWPTAGTLVVNPDKVHESVLRGAVGELCITGKLVAKGYLNRPELTKERFVHLAGQRAYRTGDLVRILHDGSFDLLGRADGQVKLRGQRLEVGEIDEVIKTSSNDVLEVSTQFLDHPQQQKQHLVSFVVLRHVHDKHKKPALVVGKASDKLIQDMRTACAERLPGYMIPSCWMPITSLPLSTNNKADGKTLQALYEALSSESVQRLSEQANVLEASASMSHEGEDRIAQALSHFLDFKDDTISRSTSLYELGLDSISVIGFARALKAAGFGNASSSMILRNASIQRLASKLNQDTIASRQHEDNFVQAARQKIIATQHQHISYVTSYLDLKPDKIETITPCTPMQLGLITRSLESTKGLYFTAFDFDLHDGIDIPRLKLAWQEVLRHTQILRTAFLPTDEGYIQVVRRHDDVSWHEYNINNLRLTASLEEKREEWWQRNQSAIISPFEIILSRTADEAVMSLHIFHACYDGNSLPMLLQCVLGTYHGKHNVDYGPDYSDVLAYGPLRESKAAKTFWTEHLQPSRHLVSKVLQPLATKTAPDDFIVIRHIEALPQFDRVRRSLHVTDQAIIQTCWAAVLQSTTSRCRVFGIVTSGRAIDFDGAERVIGPLFNTVPFLMTFEERGTWQEAITRCHDFNTGMVAFQHTPLRDIQKWTKQCRSHGAGLFDTLFVFQKEEPQTVDLEPIWTPRDGPYEADYPLSLEVVQTSEGALNVTLGVKAHISNEDVSNSILEKFEFVLRSLLKDPEQLVTQSIDVPVVHTADHVKSSILDDISDDHSIMAADKTTIEQRDWTVLEIQVRDVVATLANISSESLTQSTSILELGLDSIDAIKLSSKLKRSAGLQVSVSAIMRGLTITKIASAACEALSHHEATHDVSIGASSGPELDQYLHTGGLDRSEVQAVYPCTALQEGMVVDMLRSKGQLYFNHDILLLNPEVDVEKLREAFDRVICATPILRTRFVEVIDPEISFSMCQVVVKAPPTVWRERSVPDEAYIASILGEVTEEVMSSFKAEPPLRLTLVETAGRDRPSHLVLSLCHAMYDGWSIGLLHQDVRRAYHNEDISRPSYEGALLKLLKASSSASEAFWQQSLIETRATMFPKRSHGSAQQLNETHEQEIASTISVNVIVEFCRSIRVTVAALTQTAWACVLASYTRQLDVAYGQVLSGRDDEEANNLAFPLMNTVITRAVLHGSRKEMVQYMQEIRGTNAQYQHFPLRKALALADSSGKRGLFNTLFIFHKTPVHNHESANQLYESVGGSSEVEYPVCVEAEVINDHLIWRTACKSEVLDLKGTAELLDRLDRVLEAIVQNFEEPTIEFRKGYASVCGLPGFEERREAQSKDIRDPKEELGTTSTIETQWSHLEQTIRQVVAQVARVDQQQVQKATSIFAIGIDSISAIKMSSLLRKQSVQLSVSEILEARTIAEMARLVESRGVQETEAMPTDIRWVSSDNAAQAVSVLLQDIDVERLLAGSGIVLESVAEVLPATAGQVFMLSRWQNHGLFYPRLYFDICGCHDLHHLQKVWTKLISTHPIFRTLFVATGDVKLPIVQVVLKEAPSEIVEVPSSSTLDTIITSHVSAQGDGSVRPPVTLYAQKKEGKTVAIAIYLSHALYDGFVLPTLIEHLRKLLQDPFVVIPAEAISFPAYIARTFPSSLSRKQFWTLYLANMQPTTIQRRNATTDTTVKRNVHVVRPRIVPSTTMEGLTIITRNHHVTIQSLFLAAYARVHAYLASSGADTSSSAIENQSGGSEDILLGIYTANRTLEGADEIMAPTIGFVPIRVLKPLSRGVVEIAKDIQHDLRAIGENGRGCVGLWELDAWLKEEGESGIKVDVWINLLRSWEEDGNGLTETARIEGPGGDERRDRITIEGSEHGAREVEQDDVNEVQLKDEDVANGLLLKDNAVTGVYGPAIDLEATVHKESISIGVVAPEETLDLEGARKLIGDLARELESVEG